MNKIKTHSDYLKSVFRHKVLIHFLRIFLAVFFVSAWEICAEKGIIDSLYSAVQNGLLNVLLN